MLPGFNHNIKYKNRIFHVQTEDSGEENPLIISHLFIGGNIIATKKTNYSHLLGSENISNTVRSIMENQHKELIKELITGKYDSHPLILNETEKTQSQLSAEGISSIENLKEKKHQPEETISYHNQDKSPFKPINNKSTFTVFGEGTISEESLDQIILKFLKDNKQT